MINKVVTEILAVGQGSCNVIKGIDTRYNTLEYLAVLDAGGSSAFGQTVIDKLDGYMKDRAAASSGALQTERYADLLLISHCDRDHYSFWGKFLKKIPSPIVYDPSKKKINLIPPKTSSSDTFVSLDEAENEYKHFAYTAYSKQPSNKETDTNGIYNYHFQAEIDQEKDISLFRQFDTLMQPSYSELLICGNNYIQLSQVRDRIFTLTFSPLWYGEEIDTSNYLWNQLKLIINGSFIDMSVVYFTIDTDHSPYSFKPCKEKKFPRLGKASNFPKIPDINKIIEFIKQNGTHITPSIIIEITKFHDDMKAVLDMTDKLYGASYFEPITKDDIENELKPSSHYNFQLDKITALSFGEVVTSIAKDKIPPTVKSLTLLAPDGKHTSLIGVKEWPIPALPVPGGTSELKITMLGIPQNDADFYKKHCKGNSCESDSNHRNMNSIITIVEALGIKPHFIFPGDATVENLYYNKENNKNHLEGKGDNFFVLPHHGSSTTTYGSYYSSAVFSDFLNVVKPQCIYVSAGKNNSFGHPGIWVMNQCAAYLNRQPSGAKDDEHIIYYNQREKGTREYAYCKYPKQLYTTVTAVPDTSTTNVYKTALADYLITFEGQNAEHSSNIVTKDDIIQANKIKTLTKDNIFSKAQASRFPAGHPIYDFTFKD